MICKNCGKEISDTAIFCGYCGTKQVTEEIGEPVVTDMNEKMKNEIPVEEVTEEEEKNEISVMEEVSSEAEEVKEEVIPETPVIEEVVAESAVIESPVQEEKPIVPEIPAEKKNETKEAVKKAFSSFVSGVGALLSKINWSEFKVFGTILLHPYGDAELAVLPIMVLLVAAAAINSVAFLDVVNGLVITSFIYVGAAVILFLGKGEALGLKKLFSEVSKVVFVPLLSVLIGTIAWKTMALNVHSMQDLFINISSLKVAAVSAVSLYSFAVVMYTVSLVKAAKKMNGYLLSFLITMIIGLSVTFFVFNTLK